MMSDRTAVVERPAYRVLEAGHRADVSIDREFSLDVLVGLSEKPRQIPSKYLYDAEGSRLFTAITALPEYYPTRCEMEILEKNAGALAQLMRGGAWNLVELGPGEGEKTRVFIRALTAAGIDFHYVPLDISESAMAGLSESLLAEFPGIEFHGLVCDYLSGLEWLSSQEKHRDNFVLFLGSNIGNLSNTTARAFLHRIWHTLRHGDYLFIGFDLKKGIESLIRAYNDSAGVTAAFNTNLLTRMNRELDADFDPAAFRYFSTYDVQLGAVVSHLVSLKQQSVIVRALRKTFSFDPWEPIITAYSFKFLPGEIRTLAAATGFSVERELFDSGRNFTDSLWQVHKPPVG